MTENSPVMDGADDDMSDGLSKAEAQKISDEADMYPADPGSLATDGLEADPLANSRDD